MYKFSKNVLASIGCSAALAVMLGVVGLSGCAAGGDDSVTITPASLHQVTKSTESSSSLSASQYELGLNLLEALQPDDGNVMVSPVSLSRPLSILATGAKGQTKEQIEDVLGTSKDASLDSIADLDEKWRDIETFDSADSLWLNEMFSPKESFIDDTKRDFDAQVFERDFSSFGTVGEINSWVNEHTKGMIPGILDSLDSADFSGISDTDPLYVSEVLQKTYVEVNERGTKAAAATAVLTELAEGYVEGEIPQFREVYLDRPFLYIIRTRSGNIPLFMGTISTLEDQGE